MSPMDRLNAMIKKQIRKEADFHARITGGQTQAEGRSREKAGKFGENAKPQRRELSDIQESLVFGKGKGQAAQPPDHSSSQAGARNDSIRETFQATPEALALDGAMAKGQELEPPPTPRLESLDLDDDQELAESSLFDDEEVEEDALFDQEEVDASSVSSAERRGWAKSHGSSSPSRGSSMTSESVRSTSSGSSSSKGRDKQLAFEFDGTSQSWKPHSSKSGASVGLGSPLKGDNSLQQLKDSLRMTPIAKPGESVSQAIQRVSKLRAPPRPKPEVR